MQKLILVRGLPGSGKSTYAQEIRYDNIWSIEADMFFMVEGNYKFDMSKLKYAHAWCQGITSNFLNQGESVVVSNTFTTMRELKPYLDMAKDFNVTVEVVECRGDYGSIHGVPEETLMKMKIRWEEYDGPVTIVE